jgi:beta-mannosidase
MFDNWKLTCFEPGRGSNSGCIQPDYDDTQWLDIHVPGDVHRTLIDNGVIPDPFYDQNESECAWMEEKEWWYRLRFDVPDTPLQADERSQLIFQGIDTFATIWLNGKKLGQTNNMFHPWVYDVSADLQYGEPNILAICFDPPLQHVDKEQLPRYNEWGRNPERVFMRKAQFGYGWDWGPRLPTIGLWCGVELRRERLAAIGGVHFSTLHINPAENQAVIAVRIELERFSTDAPLTVKLSLRDADNSEVAQKTLVVEGDVATAYFIIDKPQLWWTHDLGIPYLYTLNVSLLESETELAQHSQQVGIRTIELDQSVDTAEPGTRFFRFVLNGIPVFARGACWIPADSFVGAIPDAQYEQLLTAARDGNMTMLRIWGGGIYEHNIFYELCDQLGIMVWQDFMFACAMYPEDDPAFAESIREEAVYQVRRLRNHPSLALWCGNNENQWLHDRRNWQHGYQQVPGALYYHEILPQVVAQWDGAIAYWPGSPYGGNDHASMFDGNRHNWEVWHGNGYHRTFGQEPVRENTPEAVSYLRYAEDMGRFISEFGMHAAPVRSTLERAIPAEQLYHHSPSMDHHNKDNPKNKGDNLMMGVTGLPQSLEDYIDYSMIAQAEGLKFGVEHFRRRKPHCSGALIWQFNDCWPVLSWSMMDYYGFGKASYYYIKCVYEPVIASFKSLADGSIELWITNDSLQAITDTAQVQLHRFAGEQIRTESIAYQIAANHSQMIVRWDNLEAHADTVLWVRSEGGKFANNRHFFAMMKDFIYEPQPLTYSVTEVTPHELKIELACSGFAYFVHVDIAHLGTSYSDNYFDIYPNETKTVIVANSAHPLAADDVRIAYWKANEVHR